MQARPRCPPSVHAFGTSTALAFRPFRDGALAMTHRLNIEQADAAVELHGDPNPSVELLVTSTARNRSRRGAMKKRPTLLTRRHVGTVIAALCLVVAILALARDYYGVEAVASTVDSCAPRVALVVDKLRGEDERATLAALDDLERLSRSCATSRHEAVRMLALFVRHSYSVPDPLPNTSDNGGGYWDSKPTPFVLQRTLRLLIDIRSDDYSERVDLSHSDLRNVDLKGKILRNISLKGAAIGHSDFAGTDFTDSDLSGAWAQHCNFVGAMLVDADLSGADFSGSTLDGANLDGADMSRLFINGGSLAGASLVGVKLAKAWIWLTDMTDANLARADLSGTQFGERSRADHDSVGLTPMQLNLAKVDATTELPGYLHWDRNLGKVTNQPTMSHG